MSYGGLGFIHLGIPGTEPGPGTQEELSGGTSCTQHHYRDLPHAGSWVHSLPIPLAPPPAPVGDLLMQRDVGSLRGGHERLIQGQACSLCLRDKRRRKSLHVSPLPKLVPRLTNSAHTGGPISSPQRRSRGRAPCTSIVQDVWDLHLNLLPPNTAPSPGSSGGLESQPTVKVLGEAGRS